MAGRDLLARTWCDQARADIAAAVDSTAAGHHEWACFQAQQAGEKALNSPWWNPRVAPRAVRRPPDKA